MKTKCHGIHTFIYVKSLEVVVQLHLAMSGQSFSLLMQTEVAIHGIKSIFIMQLHMLVCSATAHEVHLYFLIEGCDHNLHLFCQLPNYMQIKCEELFLASKNL